MLFKKRRHKNRMSEALTTSVAILVLQIVVADYCEFGICNENEYCCGENKCCQKTADMSYFWAAILLIGIIVLLIICIFIGTRGRCKFREKYSSYTVVVNTDVDDMVMKLP